MYDINKSKRWAFDFYERNPGPPRFWFLCRSIQIFVMDQIGFYDAIAIASKEQISVNWKKSAQEYVDKLEWAQSAAYNVQVDKTEASASEYAAALKWFFQDGGSWKWAQVYNEIDEGILEDMSNDILHISPEIKRHVYWLTKGDPFSRGMWNLLVGTEDVPTVMQTGVKNTVEHLPDSDDILKAVKPALGGALLILALGAGIYAYAAGKK